MRGSGQLHHPLPVDGPSPKSAVPEPTPVGDKPMPVCVLRGRSRALHRARDGLARFRRAMRFARSSPLTRDSRSERCEKLFCRWSQVVVEVADLGSFSCARSRDGSIVPVNLSKAKRCDRGGVEGAGILANATTRVTETCLRALRSMTPSRSVVIDRRVRVIARTSKAKRAWVVVHPIDRVI